MAPVSALSFPRSIPAHFAPTPLTVCRTNHVYPVSLIFPLWQVKSKKSATTAANSHKFIVDFSGPANDKIFDAAAYEKFLVDSIKVEGKTGQLGDDVKIAKEKEGQLSITSQIPFSKRYLNS
ncbi:BQ5605_C003g02497 [Microbotryum silenes-dioicae]|uniref:BQ5605_C003g02497 protein n=1 Tax=Microbotryum silenes-dioicae TaxID=796604 RepID=A0A2X0MP03_9BASI|nr:BQ5605_C003g02497 [Microbotryum silenes-dioicae]